jgi:outer membrane immunogenic protein
MKFAFGVCAAILAIANSGMALAADLRPIAKAPPKPPVLAYNWTGFYIGAHGGGAWADNKFQDAVGDAQIGRFTADGYFVGGQLGYNWQRDNWVFGAELEGSWAHVREGAFGGTCISQFGGQLSNCGGGGFNQFGGTSCVSQFGRTFCSGQFGAKIEALGLLTGRIGYAWDRTLVYVKGGGALAQLTYIVNIPGVVSVTPTDTRIGWVVGAGLEYGLTANWSIKVEYNYIDLGTERITVTSPVGLGFLLDHTQTVQLAKGGINYRF